MVVPGRSERGYCAVPPKSGDRRNVHRFLDWATEIRLACPESVADFLGQPPFSRIGQERMRNPFRNPFVGLSVLFVYFGAIRGLACR